MKMLDRLVRARPANLVTPADFGFNGNRYPIFGWNGSRPDFPDPAFLSRVAGVHHRNGVVSAAVEARALVLSQLWFEWDAGGRDRLPAADVNDPFGGLSAFLKRLEYDVAYHGSGYVVRDGRRLRRLRPDRVSVLLASESDPDWVGEDAQVVLPWDADVVGLVYHPTIASTGGRVAAGATVFTAQDSAVWAPEPCPVNPWRGTPWVDSVMREIVADGQATDHQTAFFENAATPNLVFMMSDAQTPDQVRQFRDVLNEQHTGTGKAYKNLFLGGGTDVKAVGSSLESLNLKDLTGGFENRVAIRSRVPAVILGAREGLSGSSLNAGNYQSARRLFVDGWFAPTADSLCRVLGRLGRAPVPGAELTYDRSRCLVMQEDEKDAADIMRVQSSAARQLVDGGFDPESVIDALSTNDLTRLRHTGRLSVQLQTPGEGEDSDAVE